MEFQWLNYFKLERDVNGMLCVREIMLHCNVGNCHFVV